MDPENALDEQEEAWLDFTDGEYYQRVKSFMASAGISEIDSDDIINSCFSAGRWGFAGSRVMPPRKP